MPVKTQASPQREAALGIAAASFLLLLREISTLISLLKGAVIKGNNKKIQRIARPAIPIAIGSGQRPAT